ncbi:MAG TPA: hypothetical protein VFH34_01170 [Anaerolineales bacterium]|nr:hypothetical protein [Anaerolineales bacterium]
MRKIFSGHLILVLVLVAVLGMTAVTARRGLRILREKRDKLAIHGIVCNHTSTDLWLAVTKKRNPKIYVLAPSRCTNFFAEDAEAIWGKECTADSCNYQAWKLGVGRFDVYEVANSSSSVVLRIIGWGAGSGWHITADWPKPDLSSIGYSLVK